MATLRNKRKLAAVSRETPESTRNGRAPNVLDPELTQDYISQVSEEIEGRVTKKLSKEFSRTESRILGALSNLDEFLLNPQVRTCSVVAPGTSRSSNLGNQGTNEDRPSDDPGPEVEFSSPISGAETDPHNNFFLSWSCNLETEVCLYFHALPVSTGYFMCSQNVFRADSRDVCCDCVRLWFWLKTNVKGLRMMRPCLKHTLEVHFNAAP